MSKKSRSETKGPANEGPVFPPPESDLSRLTERIRRRFADDPTLHLPPATAHTVLLLRILELLEEVVHGR